MRLLKVSVLFFLILGSMALSINASILYVAPSGDDFTGDGSEINPYATIQKGVDSIASGDTVIVANGTYIQATSILVYDKTVTIQSEHGYENCIIECSTVDNGFTVGYENYELGWGRLELIGLTIQNAVIQGIYVNGESRLTLRESKIDNCGNGAYGDVPLSTIDCYDSILSNNTGIAIHTAENPAEIFGNTIINNGAGIRCGINAGIEIINNMILGNADYGIYMDYRSSGSISDNLIARNNTGIFLFYGEPSFISDISHNTIVDNDIGILSDGHSFVLSDCILWNAADGFELSDSSTSEYTININHCDIRGAQTRISVNASLSWGVENIFFDPRFVDKANNDYHLIDSSPCIGAASDGSDIGAFQNALDVPIPMDIHVATTGNDETGNGTEALPFLTIQYGIDAALEGGTVVVSDGEYIGSGNINLRFLQFPGGNDNWGKYLSIQSANGPEHCIIDCQNILDSSGFILGNYELHCNTVINGFTIQNATNTAIRSGDTNPTIRNNILINNSGVNAGAISLLTQWPPGPIVENNIIMNNTAALGSGIYFPSGEGTFRNNIISNNISTSPGGAAIWTDFIWGELTFVNNLISNNTGDGALLNGVAEFINNTITNNTGHGLVFNTEQTSSITNSIIWNNGSEGILFQSSNELDISYSNIEGGQAGVSMLDGTLNWLDGNINTNPKFVDPATDNYQLLDFSPCIGAGNVTNAPTTDIIGETRGTPPDMGAFENALDAPAARIIYVSTTGSDESGDGTELNPYLTINKGATVATYGDSIIVADGTYVLDEAIDVVEKRIYVRSENGYENCIVDCGGSNGFVLSCFSSGSSAHLYIEGLTIQNASTAIYAGEMSYVEVENSRIINSSKGVYCYLTAGTKCYRSIFSGNGQAITVDGDGGGDVVECSITNNTSGVGIFSWSLFDIKKSIFSGNGEAINIGLSTGSISNNLLYNNVTCIGINEAYDIDIFNNTITDNSVQCLAFNGLQGICNLFNNILWNAEAAHEIEFAEVPDQYIDCIINTLNNNIRNGLGGYLYIDLPPINGLHNFIQTAPQFVDPTTGDYQLLDYSHCIGAGTTVGAPTTDILGITRGTPPDIGAYENALDSPHSTIYVSTNGNDIIGNGTVTLPFQTIQKGIDTAADGDTVLVADGVYTGDGNINLRLLDDPGNIDGGGKYLTVRSQNGPENCIIDCELSEGSSGFYLDEYECNSHTIIDGFTITNATNTAIIVRTGAPTIRNNILTGNSGADGGAIYMAILSQGAVGLIENNEITNNVAEFGGGIHFLGDGIIQNNVISNNISTSTVGGGIWTFFYHELTLNNNLISNNLGDGAFLHGTVNIINNTITNNSGSGLVLDYGTISIKNSIIWDNSVDEIYFHADTTDDVLNISYSDIKGGEDGINLLTGTLNLWSNIESNPRFIDPANGDYHLSDYSACIGTGTSSGSPSTDIDGITRGTPPDMGAYENPLDTHLPNMIYVATTGSDETGDGTELNPYLTINKGSIEAASSDTVIVADGTYVLDEPISVYEKDIFIKSASNYENCIIECSAVTSGINVGIGPNLDSESSLDLYGVTIQNAESYGVHLNGYSAITVYDSKIDNCNEALCGEIPITDIDCFNSVLSNNQGGAISVPEGGSTIHGNIIINNGGAISNGINGDLDVRDNIIMNNGSGIRWTHMSYAVIINNLIAGNGTGISTGDLISFDNIIRYNTIIDNTIGIRSNGQSLQIDSCILWNSPDGDEIQANPSFWGYSYSITIENCDIRDGLDRIIIEDPDITLNWGNGNITADPQFVDPASDNYQLLVSSPCIGAGNPTDAPVTDILGYTRGTPPDMGAYENPLDAPITDPFTPITDSGNQVPIVIQDILVFDAPPQPGDWVGIFDGEMCVGATECAGSFPMTISAIMEFTPPVGDPLPGAQAGNPIYYRLWDASDNTTLSATATYALGSGVFGEMLTVVSLLESYQEQTIEIASGKVNMISLNVVPEDLAAETVFTDIASLVIAQDDEGRFYIPPYSVNTIGDMEVCKGYKVYHSAAEPDTLALKGMPVDPESVSYSFSNTKLYLIDNPYRSSLPVTDVFNTITSHVVVVQDDRGTFWIPQYGVNTLGNLAPGRGYQIYVDTACDFTYPSEPVAPAPLVARIALDPVQPEHFAFTQTGLPHAVLIGESDGIFAPGDEIAVYDGTLCVGAAIFTGDYPLVITAWQGMEEYELPGYTPGHDIVLKLWRDSEHSELSLMSDSAVFEGNPISMVSITGTGEPTGTSTGTQLAYALHQNSPNPFNPSTTINYSLPRDGVVTMKVYDVTGRTVRTLLDQNMSAGTHAVRWDATDANGQTVSNGIYFVRMNSGEYQQTIKVMLLK